MPVLALQASDLAGLFLRLLPRGAVWTKAISSIQAEAVAALMPTYQRLIARDNNLLSDAFPATAEELLPEWEATLGLPDPCAGEDATVAARQAHVVARLTQSNGPSIPSLTAFMASLGFAITFTEFTPASADHLVADGPVYDPAWAFAFQVNCPGTTISYFSADHSYADDPLETWGNAVLECELRRLAPAHTVVLFAYQGSVPDGGEVPVGIFVAGVSAV